MILWLAFGAAIGSTMMASSFMVMGGIYYYSARQARIETKKRHRTFFVKHIKPILADSVLADIINPNLVRDVTFHPVEVYNDDVVYDVMIKGNEVLIARAEIA
jgi:hypothetical protein